MRCEEALDGRQIAAVILLCLFRSLQDERQTLQLRVEDDAADRLSSEVPLPDVPVAIDARAEGHLGIVEMDEPKVRHPDHTVERSDHFLEPFHGVNRVAGGE